MPLHGFLVHLRNYPNLSQHSVAQKIRVVRSIAWTYKQSAHVSMYFWKAEKTKSFAVHDDERNIFVFEVIIPVQTSSLFDY